MLCDDAGSIEIQVIQDVLDVVESRLREHERRGWHPTVPRSRIYATVLHAVIVSARETFCFPATLDRAGILDSILDGTDSLDAGRIGRPVEDAIRRHSVYANRSRRISE